MPRRLRAPARHFLLRDAFTMVEILVVTAIIAIIAALAIPLWQRTQHNSKSAACMNNLRQIGVGVTRYLTEHDQTFPHLAMARENKEQKIPTLDTELLPYVGDPKVFACPGDTKRLAETTGTSYLWNHKLNGQKLNSVTVSFVKSDSIDQHSRIMVLGDKEGWHPYLKNKLNVLYADGHASQELTFIDEGGDE
jgi:prepilin-type N-terminal cleavage/methylation domain-containing protein/prepilin-type processing-associated H-X9-DG protein